MRLKPVPEPPDDLGHLGAVLAAVPPEPDPAIDCCARVRRSLDLPTRDAASDWLAFLRALGLVEATERGLARANDGVEPGADAGRLAAAFRDRVHGAREVLDVLAAAEGPLDAGSVADRAVEEFPGSRRARGSGLEAAARDRVERLLGWAVLLGLARRAADGFLAGEERDGAGRDG